jgi:uncharacterized membrane protein
MNTRLDQIDILRGIFFIPMFIYHIFSFYDLYKNTSITDNPIIKYMGYVRNLYIILAGYSVYLSWKYKKSDIEYYKTRFKRSIYIFILALTITLLSYYFFPNMSIKFGILHFIALGTLIITPLAHINMPIITMIALVCSIYLTYPSINPYIDTVTGAQIHFSAADWFPLQKYLKLLILGLLMAQLFYIKPYKAKNKIENIFKEMGKKSLELYYSHFVILLVIYYFLFANN